MITDELSNYIREHTKAGSNKKHITDALLKVGWPEEIIEKAFQNVSKTIFINQFYKKFKRSFLLIISSFGLTTSFFLGYLLLETKNIYHPPIITFPNITEINKQSINLEYGVWPSLENANFFKDVRNKFIAEKINFIEVDLSIMQLRIYKEGVLIKEVPVLAKGQRGSWRETPAGIYKIESKEKKHLSSGGKIYTPWNLIFQGNFFIHGWPYYTNGQPMEDIGYSNGCIRLDTKDAEEIYNLVEIGYPVLIFAEGFQADNFIYQPQLRGISATSYLAADLNSNSVLLEKSSKEILSIASLTKLITALVASDYINLKKELTVEKEMIIKTSIPRLIPGQKIAVYDLFFLLIRESSNEAANVLASFLGRERFISLMNKKAQSLNMKNTKFVDPSGRDWENVSTAEDLFNLVKYIYHHSNYLFKISAGELNSSPYGPIAYADLKNFNIFDKEPEFIGGKTGLNSIAKETMMAIFEINIQNEKRPIAIIVLGSDDHEKDIISIRQWIDNIY